MWLYHTLTTKWYEHINRYTNKRISGMNINLSNVVNMDETNVDFLMDSSTTIKKKIQNQ